MDLDTIALLERLLSLAKGMLKACEGWLAKKRTQAEAQVEGK